jgi:myo-inositol-1(or 4)-monophosphatase
VRLSDAEVAVAAADAGAAIVRARFGTSLGRIEKAPMDFATDADVDAENAILDVLRAARPSDAYQGEELGASGSTASDRTAHDSRERSPAERQSHRGSGLC